MIRKSRLCATESILLTIKPEDKHFYSILLESSMYLLTHYSDSFLKVLSQMYF